MPQFAVGHRAEDTDGLTVNPQRDGYFSVVSYNVLKREVNKEKIRFFLQFLFDEGENASQMAEITNGVYGADTVTANYVQFLFRRFRGRGSRVV
ncbi:hypothetical protein TNCV_1187491 [Trichonephila clavipes]|nr:hypothetical protein TNCV_1187491 [Trichonephila clavipes]